ncbi:MAG: DUF4037 domain-containing protein [Agathobacter sp.]|nr:DUF4037 domain-containing protein [Agathobacter sp.]
MVEKLFEELADLEQVEAIALGGSRAGIEYDAKSDYDVYLYCTADVDKDVRRQILEKYCSYMEINNQFWETEDNCTLNNGIDIDIVYRNVDDFSAEVASVVEMYQPHNGYTTCMWHNLKNCKIIYDRDGRLAEAKKRFDVPYPKQLKENIIDRNMKLLSDFMPAYKWQIKKALERKDLVSVNHRTSAFLESYFDIIWAMNELTHPGEKRLVSLCLKQCKILPANFEENLNQLFADLFTNLEAVNDDIEAIIVELKKVL